MPHSSAATLRSWGILLFLALIWGSSFILIKRALVAFTPIQIASLRMVIASLILLPLVIPKLGALRRSDWKYLALVGFLGNGLPAFLFPLAETRLNSAAAGILNSLSPLFVVILGVLFFRLPVSRYQLAGVLLGLGGAVLLVLGGSETISLEGQFGYALLVVIATVGYGLSTNITKTHLNDRPAALISGMGLLLVGIPYSVYLMLFSGVGEVLAQHPQGWASLGYVTLLSAFGTAFALLLFYRLLSSNHPVFAASVTYLIPVVALGWGLLDHEQLHISQFIGFFIILIGVYFANRRPAAR
ncbi:MAG: DMT family transporter [Bacteroidia bacterium]|nr:DMT family transporter [Bacteroidia bacterium]